MSFESWLSMNFLIVLLQMLLFASIRNDHCRVLKLVANPYACSSHVEYLCQLLADELTSEMAMPEVDSIRDK